MLLPSPRACPCRSATCVWRNSAAWASCVTMTMVLPCSRFNTCSSLRISSAVSRSRSPVGSSQSRSERVRDDGTRDRNTLFLAAGQLARIVASRDRRGRRYPARSMRDLARSFATEVGQQQRQLDVPVRRKYGQQVVELKDEADVVGTPARQLAVRHRRDFGIADRRSRYLPSARSRPPIRFSSVVLPEPDGPMTATKSPSGISRSSWCSTSTLSLALLVGVTDIFQVWHEDS